MITLIGKEIEAAGDRNWLLDGKSKIALRPWPKNKQKHLAVKSRGGKEIKLKYIGVCVLCNWWIYLACAGFPRTLTQAEKLQHSHPANLVLNLIVPHSIILERVKNRWIHQASGRVYNIGFNDPKQPVSITVDVALVGFYFFFNFLWNWLRAEIFF